MTTQLRHRLLEDCDRGAFAALELAILFPFVIVMLLLVVAFGRVERGREMVDQAAQAAARAASLTDSTDAARAAATKAVQQTLDAGGMSCTGVHVDLDTTAFHPGGDVQVSVRCAADLSGLTMSGVPGHVSLSATSVSPLDPYRQLASGSSG